MELFFVSFSQQELLLVIWVWKIYNGITFGPGRGFAHGQNSSKNDRTGCKKRGKLKLNKFQVCQDFLHLPKITFFHEVACLGTFLDEQPLSMERTQGNQTI